jgi:flagellar motor protein MotB
MKSCFTILLLFVLNISLFAQQQYDPQKVSNRARRLYEQAQQSTMMPTAEGRAKTIALLQKAIEADNNYLDAYAMLASLYAKQRKYEQAIQYFDHANQIDSLYLLPAYITYAKAEAGTGHFNKALNLINRYLQRPDLSSSLMQRAEQWKDHFTFGLQSLQKHIPFDPINLGDSINSPDPEYFPNLTIDQKTLIFTRNLNNRNEDFFISHLLPDSNWSKAVPLTSPAPLVSPQMGGRKGSVNSKYNEGAQTISQDGKILIYTICNRPDGMGSCDIYFSIKTDNGWRNPQNIGPPINSPYWDSQPCLSPDNRDLYFVSNRPGGLGGSDIYVSHLQPDGSWGKPENLGENINTSRDESTPFIHADNQTLYFASDGWPGIGGVDLYYVRKNIDGSWNKPHDLGYPINTIDHDGSIFIAADGKTAYFASDRFAEGQGHGQLDLYQFTLYKAARPVRTLYVQGYVYDKKTGNRLTAKLDLIDLKTGKTLSHIFTDANGAYLVTLPIGKNYAFNVSKPGYLFYSGHFSLIDSTGKWKPFELNIGLQPLEVNARITLENIFFDFDQYNLKPESKIELNKVVQLMKTNPSLTIQINGYTDSVGSKQHNLELSKNRAQAVVDYLISKGIDKKRLQAKGYGASHPIASNETEEGRALNRRTEMVVTSVGSGRRQ